MSTENKTPPDEAQTRLVMVKPETLTIEHWMRLFEHLTGRGMTAAEIEELKAEMAADDGENGGMDT